MTDIPFGFADGFAVAIGTDIYLLGGNYDNTTRVYNYKYDTLTNTYTKMTDIPFQFFGQQTAVAVGTDIYLFGGYTGSQFGTYAYRYDTLTDTYTQLTNVPYQIYLGGAVTIGNDIYLLFDGAGATGTFNYKYNILTDTYTKLANVSFNYNDGTMILFNNNIYYAGDQSIYQVSDTGDILVTNIPYQFIQGAATTIDDKLCLFGGSTYKTKVQVLEFPSSEFEDNSIVLLNGSTYKTQLYSNDLVDNSVKYSFSDVWLYEESEGGLETDIPTYYGDGTQWINIKNPPQDDISEDEGGNEDI